MNCLVFYKRKSDKECGEDELLVKFNIFWECSTGYVDRGFLSRKILKLGIYYLLFCKRGRDDIVKLNLIF